MHHYVSVQCIRLQQVRCGHQHCDGSSYCQLNPLVFHRVYYRFQMKIRVNPNAFEKQLHIKSLEDANDAASKQIMQLKQQNAELEVRSTAKELRMKYLLRTTNLTSTELLLVESENDRYQRQTMELEQQIAELNGAAEEYRNKQVKIERELTRANDLRLQLETQS